MLILISTVLITVYLLGGVFWFAARRPDYRHVRHTLSELGERGAPDGPSVNAALFGPVGLLLLMVAGWTLLTPGDQLLREPLGYLALALGVGYFGGAIFPCDPGSPLSGSWRQQLHNLAGGVEYVGGALALYLAGDLLNAHATLGLWFTAGAGLVALVAVGLSFTVLFPVRSLIQRLGEVTLFGNLMLLAWLNR